jgi:hypothetical protein
MITPLQYSQYLKGIVDPELPQPIREVLMAGSLISKVMGSMKPMLVEMVTELTAQQAGTAKEPKPLSVKALDLIEYMDKNDFGCRRNVVKGLVARLIDEDIPIPDEKADNRYYPIGTMVVCTGNRAGHNYPLNEPCLMMERSQAIRKSGVMGNNIENKGDTIRLATPEEIVVFFEACPAVSYKVIFSQLESMMGSEEEEE